MDKLKILEEIAKTGHCSPISNSSPCDSCPIGNKCINGILIIVDCWDEVVGNKEKPSPEEIEEAYKKAATKLLLEILLEEVLK